MNMDSETHKQKKKWILTAFGAVNKIYLCCYFVNKRVGVFFTVRILFSKRKKLAQSDPGVEKNSKVAGDLYNKETCDCLDARI